jgi:hypothetical protein
VGRNALAAAGWQRGRFRSFLLTQALATVADERIPVSRPHQSK